MGLRQLGGNVPDGGKLICYRLKSEGWTNIAAVVLIDAAPLAVVEIVVPRVVFIPLRRREVVVPLQIRSANAAEAIAQMKKGVPKKKKSLSRV